MTKQEYANWKNTPMTKRIDYTQAERAVIVSDTRVQFIADGQQVCCSTYASEEQAQQQARMWIKKGGYRDLYFCIYA